MTRADATVCYFNFGVLCHIIDLLKKETTNHRRESRCTFSSVYSVVVCWRMHIHIHCPLTIQIRFDVIDLTCVTAHKRTEELAREKSQRKPQITQWKTNYLSSRNDCRRVTDDILKQLYDSLFSNLFLMRALHCALRAVGLSMSIRFVLVSNRMSMIRRYLFSGINQIAFVLLMC